MWEEGWEEEKIMMGKSTFDVGENVMYRSYVERSVAAVFGASESRTLGMHQWL